MSKYLLVAQTNWGPKLQAFLDFLINDGLDEQTARDFIEYHLSKKELWKTFEEIALRCIKSNIKKRWGAKELMVFALLKLSIQIDAQYPHTNSMTAYYSRLFRYRYPALGKYIRENKIRGLTRPRLEGYKAA